MKIPYLILAFSLAACTGPADTSDNERQPMTTPQMFAAPGRIEGATDNIDLGYPGTALVGEILVHEGEAVKRNQVLTRMDCQVLHNEFLSAQAEQAVAEEDLVRLTRGARREEIEVAAAETEEAIAIYEQALANFNRVIKLKKHEFSSTHDLDAVKRDLAVSEAKKEVAIQRLALVKEGALPEEIRRSKHAIKAAAARKESIQSRLDKCDIVSPVDGIVLRVHVDEGELVSELNPVPIISVADVNSFRVRAEIDELDVGRVTVGQRAQIFVDAFSNKKLNGEIEELGVMMGRKRIRSIDPAEKSDRDVLEVLVGLDEADFMLPIGLRVTVLFAGDYQQQPDKVSVETIERGMATHHYISISRLLNQE